MRTQQNVWNAANKCLGEIIAPNAHIKEEKRSEINHPSFHLSKLGKYEQIKSEVSRKK